VGIGLVPGVPHDPVARRIHHPVEGQRDLDRSQRAGQVPAGALHGADHLLAQLGGQRFDLARDHAPQLGRIGQCLKDRHGGRKYSPAGR
jgi:hypothetical protein